MKLCGIYLIENIQDKKSYIGSSKDIRARWYRHLKKLHKDIHENDYLQNAFNKHGEKSFKFKVLKLVENEKDLKKEEQIFLDEAKEHSDLYYNINFDANRINFTDEVRQKMSRSAKRFFGISNRFYGKKHSKEAIKKIKLARKNQIFTEETRQRLSEASKKYWEKRVNRYSKIDQKIYRFQNTISKEIFTGRRFDFYTIHKLKQDGVTRLVHGCIKSHKGWVLL